MESLYLLIPVALAICVIAIRFLLWAINNGQYDDLDREAWRILAEDDTESLQHRKNAVEQTQDQSADD